MRRIPHPPLPSLSAECETITHSALARVQPASVVTKVFRSGEGKMRVDYGDKSMITDPQAGTAIALDHVKKEATIFHIEADEMQIQAAAASPDLPAAPQISAAPKVSELGKKIIDGHEAEGFQYDVHPPAVPKLPDAPKPPLPALDAAVPPLDLPDAPKLPKIPSPALPQALPQKVEVWTSTKLKFPVLTTVSGSFGTQTSRCKKAAEGEPPASMFQIPSGYQTIKPPKPPALPRPHAPKAPFR